jgi:hypothetical protein
MNISNYFRQRSLPADSHGTIRYYDQTTVTRNADVKAENASAPESALAWTEESLGIGKILDSIPFSLESINDTAWVEEEIRRFIDTNIRLKLNQQVWAGNGTLPEFDGIYTSATDFTQVIATAVKAGGLSAKVATLSDLIVIIAAYMANGKEGKYTPNVVFLNPLDAITLKLQKDANNNYILPPFVSRDGKMIGAVQIVEASVVTQGTLCVGDGRYAEFYSNKGVELEFGYNTGDFMYDRMTLKGRVRGNLLLRAVDATAFYKVTDITTRITDLTA